MDGAMRVRALVAGRVQAVGYRFSTQLRARELGLVGWVRNLPDGRVELEAEGPPSAVEALLDWAARGPAGASVVRLEREPVPTSGGAGFEIRG